MIKAKPIFFDAIVTPDISLHLDTGETVSNKDLPVADQTRAELTYANPEQKERYMSSVTRNEFTDGKVSAVVSRNDWRIEEAIRKHVKKVTGPLAEYYPDGNGLWDGPPSEEKEQLCLDLFFRIVGIRTRGQDAKTEQGDDGPGELTTGESKASE